MADFSIIVDLDTEVSYENIKAGISNIKKRIDAEPLKIKVDPDSIGIKKVLDQIKGLESAIKEVNRSVIKIGPSGSGNNSAMSKDVEALENYRDRVRDYLSDLKRAYNELATWRNSPGAKVSSAYVPILEKANDPNSYLKRYEGRLESNKSISGLSRLAKDVKKEWDELASVVERANRTDIDMSKFTPFPETSENTASKISEVREAIKNESSELKASEKAYENHAEAVKTAAEAETIKGNVSDKLSEKLNKEADATKKASDKSASQDEKNRYKEAEKAVKNYYKLVRETFATNGVVTRGTDGVWQSADGRYKSLVNDLNEARIAMEGFSNSEKLSEENRNKLATLRNEKEREYIRLREAADEKRAKLLEDDTKVQIKYNNAISEGESSIKNWSSAEHSRTRSSREAYAALKLELEGLRQQKQAYDAGQITQEQFNKKIDAFKLKLKETGALLRQNGDDTKSFASRVKALASRFSAWFTASQMVMLAIRSIKQMIQEVVALDSSLAQMQIVTGESAGAMEKFANTALSSAKRLGVAATDFIDSATTFARLGYNMDEASMLAEYTTMLQNVGNIDTQAAQDSITSIIKAFDVDVNDIETIMDKLVTTGNNFPISVSQIAEGMMNASSALAATGNTFEQSVALLTAANTTIQNASKSSTGLRTIAARLRNTKTELDDLGETMTEASYGELVAALTKYNVALTDANGEFRSTYDIIRDIANMWDTLGSMEQAALANAIAGVRQQSIFYSLVQEFAEASGSVEAMMDSTGALQKSYDVYLDSMQGRINQFKAAFQDVSQTIIDKDIFVFLVNVGTRILGVINGVAKLVNALGGLKTVLLAISTIVVGFNAGKVISTIGKITTKITALSETLKALRVASSGSNYGITSFAATIKGLLKNIGSIRLATLAITAAIVAISALARHFKELREQRIADAREDIQYYNEQKESVEDYAKRVGDLKERLADESTSYEETVSIRKELLSIQDELIEKYGLEADAINLIGDSASKSAENIRELTAELANSNLNQNYKVIREAAGHIETVLDWNSFVPGSSVRFDFSSAAPEIGQRIREIVGKYSGAELYGNGNVVTLDIEANPEDAIKAIDGISYELTQLQNELKASNPDFDINDIVLGKNDVFSTLNRIRSGAAEIAGDYSEIYNNSVQWTIDTNKSFQAIISIAEEAKQAYDDIISGVYTTEEERYAALQSAYNKAEEAKNLFLNTNFGENEIGVKEYIQDLIDSIPTLEQAMDSISTSLSGFNPELNTLSSVTDKIKSMTDSFATLADIQQEVADGFVVSLEKALEFAEVYPEILDNAQVTADGQIQLNEDVVNSLIDGKQAEMQAEVEARITNLEAEKAVLEAKKSFAEAELELAYSVGTGEGKISAGLAAYKIDLANKVLQNLIDHGISEEQAYAIVTENMSADVANFANQCYQAAANIDKNFRSASMNMADNTRANVGQAVKSLGSLIKKAFNAAQAMIAIGTGHPVGDVTGDAVAGGGISSGSNLLTAYKRSRTGLDRGDHGLGDLSSLKSFSFENIIGTSLESYIPQIENTISEYEARIAEIDGEIAILKALAQKSLDDFNADKGGSNSGGSGSPGGSQKKEIEAYIADIDELYLAMKRLESAQLRVAGIQAQIDAALSDQEKIPLTNELITAYREEAAAQENLMSKTRDVIRSNIKELEDLGFQIYYNAETNEFYIKNLEHLNELYDSNVEEQNELRKSTEELINATDALNKSNQESAESFREATKNIREAQEQIIEYLNNIVQLKNEILDTYQNVYETLQSAADEYASTGYLTVDTLQNILGLGTEYMQYLTDENGALVINRERIEAVIAAKTENLAVEQALAYVERLRLALMPEAVESLDELLYATKDAANSTWDLVYANLRLLDLDTQQYNAALHNINAMRMIANAARNSIGTAGDDLKTQLSNMKSGMDDILKYVMDMLRHKIDEEKQSLEDMKTTFGEIISLRKESLNTAKKESDYQKDVASKTKEIARLQARISSLMLDNSREATAKRMQLEEELAKLQGELADTQADHAREAQEEALDKMQTAYEEEKDKEIKKLEESISSQEKLYRMAIDYIGKHWNTLYDELIDWNTEYGLILARRYREVPCQITLICWNTLKPCTTITQR